jgi:hypothetical protein
VLLGLGLLDLDIRPEVRTMAPVSRERIKVLWTPGFWLSRVRWAMASSCCCWLVLA